MTTTKATSRPPAPVAAVAAVGLLSISAYIFTLMWSMSNTDYDTWGALVVAPVLIAITFPLARHVASIEDDPRLVKLILAALAFKLLGSLARYYVAFDVYGGSADAAVYLRTGYEYYAQLRQGIFPWEQIAGGSAGTTFTMRFTTVVIAIIGPTGYGAFLVFSWLSFWGLYFFYRAFRIGVPHGDHLRYAALIFFLPSLLFWPSSVGKEAWMMFTLGLGAYGAARLLTHQRGGYLVTGLGIVGTSLVRPHMTVLLCAGLAGGYLLRRTKRGSTFGPITRIIGASVVCAALLFAVQAAEERFDVEGQGLAGAEQVIDDTAEQTAKGGSEFDARRPSSPRDIPMAVFTVMFRPLPHEAHNMQALLSSFEGLVLLVLFVASWSRLRSIPREMWRSPYVTFALGYALLFMLAFSSFGNFGILARQRAQLFPLVLVVLALPTIKKTFTAARA